MLGRILSLGRMINVFPCLISHLVWFSVFPWGAQCVWQCGMVLAASVPLHTLQLPHPWLLRSWGCLGRGPCGKAGLVQCFGLLVLGGLGWFWVVFGGLGWLWMVHITLSCQGTAGAAPCSWPWLCQWLLFLCMSLTVTKCSKAQIPSAECSSGLCTHPWALLAISHWEILAREFLFRLLFSCLCWVVPAMRNAAGLQGLLAGAQVGMKPQTTVLAGFYSMFPIMAMRNTAGFLSCCTACQWWLAAPLSG